MLLALEAAFTAVKWGGASYLFWMGWRAWRTRELARLQMLNGGEAPQGQTSLR